MIPTIYLPIEDDVKKIALRLRQVPASEVVLAMPKGSFLFSDPINLKLLKKQADLLGKTVSILTMDVNGQRFAVEAGLAVHKPGYMVKPAQKILVKQPTEKKVISAKGVSVAQMGDRSTSGTLKTARPRISSSQTSAPVVASVLSGSKQQAPVRLKQQGSKPTAEGVATRHRGISLFLLFFVIGSLVLAAALLGLVLPKAEIVVTPRTESFNQDVEVTINTKSFSLGDKLVVEGKGVEKTFDKTINLSTQGRRDIGEKARGQVAIYNLTGSSINLKKGTTVLTLGNKNYFFTIDQVSVKSITPAAASNPNTTLVPIDVIAEAGGEGYNIPNGTRLEITNQVFGSKPQVLYAKVITPIEGGSSRFVSQITAEDETKAKAELGVAAVTEFQSELKSKDLLLPEKAYQLKVENFVLDKPVGTDTPTFEASARVSIKGIAFTNADIHKAIRNKIESGLVEGFTLQPEERDMLTAKTKIIDLESGVLVITANFSTLAVAEVDVNGITQKISRKNQETASQIILADPHVEKVSISLSPQWQPWLPVLGRNIKISTSLEP